MMEPTGSTTSIDPLAEMLERFENDTCYRVDALIKQTQVERTERVYRLGADGAQETGPFIRKYIDRQSGLGEVYQLLFDKQQAGRRLNHVPHILDCGLIGDKLVVVMETAPGKTLAACVEALSGQKERLDFTQRVFPELCDAVEEPHTAFERPIIHRDITPTNVMVDLDEGKGHAPCVMLLDFGISRVFKPQADHDTAYLGTRPYAPPEQCGFGQTSVQTDVYALGAVLFYCLTGRSMSNNDRLIDYADPSIPGDLRLVIAKACALDAKDRYTSARDLKVAFEACQSVRAVMRARLQNPAPARPPVADERQANDSPEQSPRPHGAVLALLARLPDAIPIWICRVWNAFIALNWVLYAYASWFTTSQALPEGTPFWLNRCYATFYVLLFSSIAYVLYDKRRLFARLGLKHHRSLPHQIIRCVLIILASLAILLAINVTYTVAIS